ncbi:bifunctional folylpolyglutamate synthase/dihydrofolate synthase [Biomaibacter acetigenes]|uniref:Dihydrofolate synthase/folylpolyglutamate synthase n=1 Tax=Biomaibacter acetigenes TaxID=2316383 RepID=A0A3G2R3X6_9FIRM|nr:folylpolyglutamate synthase/dihydrofolate synthase family protein [Biomaibacter acetigenes]AYO30035.1 bifunctional folylpolyglutamate synthase/dihydrofolate synthase [Biomaibacter acetigenes]
MLNYDEALEYIHGLNKFGTKLGLDNITRLLEILGNPHHGMRIIHVAGTNGKGSTCAMIDSILRAAGYKVGLYTSPYLEVFNERIRVNGKNIPDKAIARLTQKVRDAISIMQQKNLGHPTEFEVVTAIGFLYFKEQAVDFIVLEVGMGGRLDATNVAMPLVSVITPISFDHQKYLGNTLADISREKCGIIKKGVPVVSGPQEKEALRVIEETCARRGCILKRVLDRCENRENIDFICYNPLRDSLNGQVFDVDTPKNHYSNLKIRLLGSHQLDNAATVVGAIEALELSGIKISRDAIYSGLENARWPGRLEILRENPTVLIDGAHNIAGIRTLKEAILKYFPQKKKILVLGILKDKDYNDMIEEIVPLADAVITTAPDNPRALSAEELAETIRESRIIHEDKNIEVYVRNEIKDALTLSLEIATPGDLIVFAGSLYMIGRVRTIASDLR